MPTKMKFALSALGAATVVSLTVAACGGSDVLNVTQGTVINNATVVDTRDGSLHPNLSVVLDGGKVVAIKNFNDFAVTGITQLIDATGKFVVPGFVDMHTHAMVHADQRVTYFPMMIANGITSFREMGAFTGQFPQMVARAKQLNADIAAGKVDAPDALLIPSDIFQSVAAAASAVQGVDQQVAFGVDFIKVISANRAAMLAFLSEAKSKGTYVSGHLTPAVSAVESSQLGWKTIEHLVSGMGVLLDCSTDETNTRQAAIAAAGNAAPAYPADSASLQHLVDTYSIDKCKAIVQTFIQNGTWNVPTLRRVRALDATDDAFFQNDPNLIYVDRARIALWNNLTAAFAAQPAAAKAALKKIYALQQSVAKLMKQSGAQMMAGSDAGVASVWVIPGIGLHQDFHELAASGLSPLDILQMTTLNPAAFTGHQSTMGTVDVGKNADLVLLDADPTADAGNLDKIFGVFLKGKYFSKDALAKLLSDTAAGYASAAPLEFAVSPEEASHRD